MLWLHGFLSDGAGEKAACFRERMLAAGRAFSTFDFRGHGKSGGDLRDLTCEGLLEDAAAMAGPLAARYRNVVLVGSSMGAWTAAWHAVRNPGSVAALVLIAPAFRWPGVLAAEAGPEAAARWEREGTIVHDAGFRTVTLGWDLVRGGAAFPLERLAASLATPTLLLQGTRDASCPWRDSARFAEETAAPDVELRLLEGGDHRLTDRKDLLADAAHAFLAARGL